MAKTKHILVVDREAASMRLDRFLREVFPHLQQSLIEKMLRKGDVRINGSKVKSSHRLVEGEGIAYPEFLDNLSPSDVEKRLVSPLTPAEREMLATLVLFEDEHLLALNKPSGLATQGGSGVKRSVDQFMGLLYPDAPPRLVHRLDKDTSGVLLLAKTRAAAQHLTHAFREKTPQKTYLAVVVGTPIPGHGLIDLPLTKSMVGKAEKVRVNYEEGLSARTHYKVLEAIDADLTLLELKPETGRTHQLRVHCADGLNTPILGDGKYGGKASRILENAEHETVGRPKLHLHALSIAFPHPETGDELMIEAPMPLHFRDTLGS